MAFPYVSGAFSLVYSLARRDVPVACARGVFDRALREHGNRQAVLFLSRLIVLGGEWPRLPFTARIERAHSYRARSASKKGTWPRPEPFLIRVTSQLGGEVGLEKRG
jgi:hypothetical protein